MHTQSVAERFWAKVHKTDACWLWRAATSSTGYGVFAIAQSGRSAHRVAYELTYGAVSPDLEIDHVCGQRLCVNPSHLQAVSSSVNKRRAWNRDETKCRRGHPRGAGERCQVCERAGWRAQFHGKTLDWALAHPVPTPLQKREMLVVALRELALRLGRTPAARDINQHGRFAHETFVRQFGSLAKAQIAAGLVPNKVGHRAMALAS